MSDPAYQSSLLEGLPGAVPALVEVVQTNLVHVFWAGRYGLVLDDIQKSALQVRPLVYKLERIRSVLDAPLAMPRPLELRQVGNCRDFSLLLCGLFRHLGIPARARCGFATYFIPGHYEDHWVCEYWNAAQKRWVMVDAQLDELQRHVLQLDFDPLDMPPGKFIAGGQAWKMCRDGEADPDQFGIMEMKGWWFVWGNVVRDVLALNKVEILPWDGGWGPLTTPLDAPLPGDEALQALDQIAALSIGVDDNFTALREFFLERPEWCPPSEYEDAATD